MKDYLIATCQKIGLSEDQTEEPEDIPTDESESPEIVPEDTDSDSEAIEEPEEADEESEATEEEAAERERIYPGIRKISVDNAIMEPAAVSGDVLMIPGDFGWNDVGSWDMMNILHKEDQRGNVLIGDTVSVGIKNTTIYSGGRTVAAVGVEGLIIAETPDAVLVCRRDRAQDVRLIVEKLRASSRNELL